MIPKHVKIYEVGPRDGLQNESGELSLNQKIEFINDLSRSGLQAIEVGSFVSPKAIPQMAGTLDVIQGIKKISGVSYSALVPNMKGMEGAIASGISEIAVFAAASESFSKANINCSIEESLERFRPVLKAAKEHNIRVRGYVSCIAGCPYEGSIKPEASASVAKALFEMGCYEISLGDTIGVGTPQIIQKVINAVSVHVSITHLAFHGHDTYGQALANAYAALECGVAVLDSSVGGLGGCPYAPGASGNVATEDVLYLLQGLGVETGVNLSIIVETGRKIGALLNKPVSSKVAHVWSPDNIWFNL